MMNGRVGLKVLLVLSIVQSVKGDKGKTKVIGSQLEKAVVGENKILPCYTEPQRDVRSLTVEWKRDSIGSLVHLYTNGQNSTDGQLKSYKERTSLFEDQLSKGNLSLKLQRVQLSDTGNYTCSVVKLVPEEKVTRHYVYLTVSNRTEDKHKETELKHDPGEGENSPEDGGVKTALKLGLGIGIPALVMVLFIGIGLIWCLANRGAGQGAGGGVNGGGGEDHQGGGEGHGGGGEDLQGDGEDLQGGGEDHGGGGEDHGGGVNGGDDGVHRRSGKRTDEGEEHELVPLKNRGGNGSD